MDWFIDDFSKMIWESKYQGDAPDVRTFFKSLADRVSLGDSLLAHKFFQLMWNKKFIPGGRILAYAGRPTSKLSLMNCTTHKVDGDSLESIADTVYAIMRASSRGQGIGVDISELRPVGSPVNNAAKTSTGSISFMEMFNQVGFTIGQEGRRAALLFSLDIKHPDAYRNGSADTVCSKCSGAGCSQCNNGFLPYDFINIKKVQGRVENANISLRLSDRFMNAVENDRDWIFSYKGSSGGDTFYHETYAPAATVMHSIAKSAWESAEPGVLYWDNSRKMSNSDLFGSKYGIVGVNACSEQVLDQDGVCLLGSVNLASYVLDPFTSSARFDYTSFYQDVALAVEFLDNVIDIELQDGRYVSQRQMESLINLRRVGLGVMGFADMLAMLGYYYGDNIETNEFTNYLFSQLRNVAYATTIELAKRKGPCGVWLDANGDYRTSIVNKGFFATLPNTLKEAIIKHGTRNITVLSIAPTGTISNLIGVSSSIEPVFAHQYTRRTVMRGIEEFVEYVHPGVQLARLYGVGSDIYPTAYELSPQDHLNAQAITQVYVDSSISKTINMPSGSSISDVEYVYKKGHASGLKGLSIYVDGSREVQTLYVSENVTAQNDNGCPECGEELSHESGCISCPACGYAVCSV